MLFSELGERVEAIKARIAAAAGRGGHGQEVTIVAVTKSHGADAVSAAWSAGLANIGENRVQEALGKMESVMEPVRWHLIGHLQRNKIRALDRFTLFHALDSARLADGISRFGEERGTAVDVLVQVNPAREQTKGGFEMSAVAAESVRLAGLRGLRVRGAMTIARLGAEEAELRETFAAVRETCRTLAEAGHPATELSMGMSDDFEIAVEEGATMVRLGSVLFGARAK